MYTQEGLARDSSYEGWVAWVDGHAVMGPDERILGYDKCTALFEEIKHQPELTALVRDSKVRTPRASSRQTIEWKNLPHDRVVMLELYAFRDTYRHGGAFGVGQPVVSMLRPYDHDVRWIQFKRGGVIVPSVSHRDQERGGQRRTGISAWVIGYWNRTIGQAEVWEVPAAGGKWPPKLEFQGINHPCWPRPFGFGYAPHVLGLAEEEVPSAPLLGAMERSRLGERS